MKILDRLRRVIEQDPARGVPEQDRRSWLFLASIQVGTTICIPMFALGGQLGQHQSFANLVGSVGFACIIISALAMVSGTVGLHSRLPTALLVRHTFGELGARVVALILMVTLFGWFGVQTEVLVHSIKVVARESLGLELNAVLVTLASGLTMGTTAIIGAKALGKVAYVAVPLLLLTFLVPSAIALQSRDLSTILHAAPAGEPYSFGMIVSIVAGGHMLAVTVMPDVTRFLRRGADNVAGSIVSFGLALPVLLLMSSLLSIIYGSGDLIRIMIGAGVGVPALVVIFLATWTSNDKNLYESALAMNALAPGVARWKLTALATMLGTGLAMIGIFGHFITLLVMLGITIAPMAATYLVDFLLDSERYRAINPPQRLRLVNCSAWAFGLLIGVMVLPREELGLQWFTLTTIPALDALLAAAAWRVAGGLSAQLFTTLNVADS